MWSDAARAAALEARRKYQHLQGRGGATQSEHNAHIKRMRAIRDSQGNASQRLKKTLYGKNVIGPHAGGSFMNGGAFAQRPNLMAGIKNQIAQEGHAAQAERDEANRKVLLKKIGRKKFNKIYKIK